MRRRIDLTLGWSSPYRETSSCSSINSGSRMLRSTGFSVSLALTILLRNELLAVARMAKASFWSASPS